MSPLYIQYIHMLLSLVRGYLYKDSFQLCTWIRGCNIACIMILILVASRQIVESCLMCTVDTEERM